MKRWLAPGVAAALVLVFAVAAGYFYAESTGLWGSLQERLSGETPEAKVAAYVRAVTRGDEQTARSLWELPPNAPAGLGERRDGVTRDLISRGVKPDVEVLGIEWWRTCCEPGVIDRPRDAGGARLRVRLSGQDGAVLDYVFDVFDRDGAYWGAATGYRPRHWVLREAYPAGIQPLYWQW